MKLRNAVYVLLPISVAHGAVTMTNEPNTTDTRILLNGNNSTNETVMVTQTFTVGDAQSPGQHYDFDSLSFNAISPDLVTVGGVYRATLFGLGVAPATSEDFVIVPGDEMITFPGSQVQLMGGEDYMIQLEFQRADDDPSDVVSLDYTENGSQTATGDSGETINNWSIANTATSSGGQINGFSLPIEMTVVVSASVPEPSSAGLVAMGLFAFAYRRNRSC